MVFCNSKTTTTHPTVSTVTIVILIDGFLQFINGIVIVRIGDGHNPYFNRWFSAILTISEKTTILA